VSHPPLVDTLAPEGAAVVVAVAVAAAAADKPLDIAR
jgi:hypothetical protein